jgi:monovalent cation:H+ antiporter-2, CPA2 family
MSQVVPGNQYLVVIGYGVPGRAVVDLAKKANIEVCVIENNAHTVKRCEKGGPPMIAGDARDPAVLQQADISRASIIVVAIPDQEAVLQITRLARELNKSAKLIARCHYTSVGFELHTAGANEVIVAEQVVAREMSAILTPLL